jgi:hypothetical protein
VPAEGDLQAASLGRNKRRRPPKLHPPPVADVLRRHSRSCRQIRLGALRARRLEVRRWLGHTPSNPAHTSTRGRRDGQKGRGSTLPVCPALRPHRPFDRRNLRVTALQ